MAAVLSPIIPFPNIDWWKLVTANEHVLWDEAEHFEKMTYRNRYYVTGPNGLVQLSIPLQNGRNQRCTMRDVLISNRDRWQIQQWRTLVSVYNRSPFFSFYAMSLEPVFLQPYERLIDFNMASIQWLKQQLKLSFTEETISEYKKVYDNNTLDIRRSLKPGKEKDDLQGTAPYYQLFSERNGFLPNLSMLDLLFSEGPQSLHTLKTMV
ncbi:MAG: hypothetical protein EOP51_07580 [Sphingobacteriales bacterium]|nr:MAG: hypothetical protein EOP51_07580 [Sphingobacteriales bacterium]